MKKILLFFTVLLMCFSMLGQNKVYDINAIEIYRKLPNDTKWEMVSGMYNAYVSFIEITYSDYLFLGDVTAIGGFNIEGLSDIDDEEALILKADLFILSSTTESSETTYTCLNSEGEHTHIIKTPERFIWFVMMDDYLYAQNFIRAGP